jgi:hypothetical protein
LESAFFLSEDFGEGDGAVFEDDLPLAEGLGLGDADGVADSLSSVFVFFL